ncbi:MAG: RNA ligase (ATP), partial [Armatimonadota bacterium]|nr:RNA ligase (ATP) [Armatimonadota bacterium]
MSTLIVEISRIEKIFEHPNADALELAHIKGWQCVIPKGKYSPGDLVTYVPVDSVLPVELSDRVGITKYLSNGRVRCARLRGEPSFGVILDRENSAWDEGRDVADYYGITKYEPPVRISMEDAETPHPLLQRYTDIENLRNFPDVLREGEEVVVTEKIHGTNCKVGII